MARSNSKKGTRSLYQFLLNLWISINLERTMAKSEKPFKSNFAVAPGRYVKEYMDYYDYSFQKFADLCGCSVKSVKDIVIDRVPLSMSLAKKFEKVIDIPSETLMRIEEDYRSRIKTTAKVKKRVKEPLVAQQPFAVD